MNTEYLDKNTRVIVAGIVAVLTILFVILVSFMLELRLVENLVLSWVFTTLYSLFAFFLIEDKRVFGRTNFVDRPVYVDRPVDRIVDRVVIQEVPIQIPVENRTIEVVDRPVEVERVVPAQRRTLNLPKYNFVASSQARTFHKRSCRLGKMIKKKYKIQSNSKAFFKRKRFKACKSCINKSKSGRKK